MGCFQIILRLKTLFRQQPEMRQRLALYYRQNYSQSLFYDVCQNALQHITYENCPENTSISSEGEKETHRNSVSSLTKSFMGDIVESEQNEKEHHQSKGKRLSASKENNHYEVANVNNLVGVGMNESIMESESGRRPKTRGQNSKMQIGDLLEQDRSSSLSISQRKGHGTPSDKRSPNPCLIKYLPPEQKQALAKRLIKQSYPYLDLTEILTDDNIEMYESVVKGQLFEEQESLMNSFLAKRQSVLERLKYFDGEALSLLDGYVKFCASVQQQCKILPEKRVEAQEFLAYLMLKLKEKFLTEFSHSKMSTDASGNSKLNDMIESFDQMVRILMGTIEIWKHVNFLKTEDNDDYGAGNESTFFIDVNLHTLVCSILFQDEEFANSIYENFKCALRDGMERLRRSYEQSSYEDDEKFETELKKINLLLGGYREEQKSRKKESKISAVISLDHRSSNMRKILQKEHHFPYFKRSLRTLESLSKCRAPLKTLKVVYELNKTILKDNKQFIESIQKNLTTNSQLSSNERQGRDECTKKRRLSFSRDSQNLIIEWMLVKRQNVCESILINCLIGYTLTHTGHLMGQKGSCITPFIEIVEKFINKSRV